MTTNVPLTATYATVTLDASGNGTAKVGPLTFRETWHPSMVHVGTQQNVVTNEATCNVYVGDTVRQQTFRDVTFTGSSGDATDTVANDVVRVGQWVWAVWEGGDPGALAVVNVTGTRDI